MSQGNQLVYPTAKFPVWRTSGSSTVHVVFTLVEHSDYTIIITKNSRTDAGPPKVTTLLHTSVDVYPYVYVPIVPAPFLAISDGDANQ